MDPQSWKCEFSGSVWEAILLLFVKFQSNFRQGVHLLQPHIRTLDGRLADFGSGAGFHGFPAPRSGRCDLGKEVQLTQRKIHENAKFSKCFFILLHILHWYLRYSRYYKNQMVSYFTIGTDRPSTFPFTRSDSLTHDNKKWQCFGTPSFLSLFSFQASRAG